MIKEHPIVHFSDAHWQGTRALPDRKNASQRLIRRPVAALRNWHCMQFTLYTTLYWSQSSASAWKTSVPEAIKILQGTLHVNLNRWYRAELISKWHKTEINFWWRTWVERWKMAIFSFPHTEKEINIFTEINHLQKFLQLFTQHSWKFGIDKYLWCALWHFIYDMQD